MRPDQIFWSLFFATIIGILLATSDTKLGGVFRDSLAALDEQVADAIAPKERKQP